MTLPYTKTLQVQAVSAQANCIELPAPIRGIITRLIVKDKDSGVEGFTFDLYDREDACSNVTESSYYNDDERQTDFENELLDPELHKLQATQTIAAATAVSEQFDIVLPYENKDEGGLHERRQSKIYMELTPSGSGTKTFQIAYTVTQVGFH